MRNVVSLYYSFVAEGRPAVRQVQCMRVWDDGISECLPVIGTDKGSKFALGENPAHFHRVLSCKKKMIRTFNPGIANVVRQRLCTGTIYLYSSSSRSIAKSMQFITLSGGINPPLESLSRMMGNYQVRFLGDEGGVIRLSYLTKPLMQLLTNRK
jgi:hypothetical protein